MLNKKMYENTDSYMSLKSTIYLEKDNGKWEVTEFDEKLKITGKCIKLQNNNL